MYNENELIDIFKQTLCAKNIEELLEREIFNEVLKEDRSEVIQKFAGYLRTLGTDKRVDNLRLYPISQKKKYLEIKLNGNRQFFDTKIYTSSKNVYLLGFNHD